MGKTGQWVNEPGNTEVKEGNLNEGDRWFIPYGTDHELPIPREGYCWEADGSSPQGRFYRFTRKNEIPSLEEENANLRVDVSKKSREIFTLQRDLRQANQDKAAITEAFDKRGEEYNDLREAMRKMDSLIESRKEEHNAVYRENLQLKEELKAQSEPKDECVVAEQSPAAAAYEDIHTKRMAAEVESIELDNLKKKNELKFGEDYPHSIWHNLSTRLKDTENMIKNAFFVGSMSGVLLLINEVIQWVSL